jgi:hypothetical protein
MMMIGGGGGGSARGHFFIMMTPTVRAGTAARLLHRCFQSTYGFAMLVKRDR